MLNKLYVANWKMYLSYTQACAWLQAHKQELLTLAQNNNIVLCPDFTMLQEMQDIVHGAQNCAAEQTGAYTGEIAAQSLKELGCSYCIVGHSERRLLFGETTETCVKKIAALQQQNITPLYCIGEQDSDKGSPYETLKAQLDPVFNAQNLIIAYEPVWAIGTGITPDSVKLTEVVAWIKEYTDHKYPIMYGGSVTEFNITELKKIDALDGFLIGKASTDFQHLKKIVLSIEK